eukprot:2563639-Pleurochrysis_carterae.AAC.1
MHQEPVARLRRENRSPADREPTIIQIRQGGGGELLESIALTAMQFCRHRRQHKTNSGSECCVDEEVDQQLLVKKPRETC